MEQHSTDPPRNDEGPASPSSADAPSIKTTTELSRGDFSTPSLESPRSLAAPPLRVAFSDPHEAAASSEATSSLAAPALAAPSSELEEAGDYLPSPIRPIASAAVPLLVVGPRTPSADASPSKPLSAARPVTDPYGFLSRPWMTVSAAAAASTSRLSMGGANASTLVEGQSSLLQSPGGFDRRTARKINSRTEKWRAMMASGLLTHPKLRSRLWKGVPDALRGAVWCHLALGRPEIAEEDAPDPRSTWTLKGSTSLADPSVEKAIELDLNRTFPQHVMFASSSDGAGREALRRVLRRYALLDPIVGYCQGMSFLAALFLTYVPERTAGMLFYAAMTQYRFRDMFVPGLTGVHVHLQQYDDALMRVAPRIATHFKKLGYESGMYASQWFMTGFAYSFDFALVCRVWDVCFMEGWRAIIAVACAVMVVNFGNSNLAHLDMDAASVWFKQRAPTSDPDLVMRLAHGYIASGAVSDEKLAKSAKKFEQKTKAAGKKPSASR